MIVKPAYISGYPIKKMFFAAGLFAAVCFPNLQSLGQEVQKPRLVVNIVVSQMRYDYLDRFADNFADQGFRLFLRDGVNFTSARHNYMQTSTPAGLATIATGTNPSGHGIVSANWIDYTTKRNIGLIDDPEVNGFDCDPGSGRYSARNLTAATLGDNLKMFDPKSRVVSIALDPMSAIVSGGASAEVYWMDTDRGNWITSSFFADRLPSWVTKYNDTGVATQYLNWEWELMRPADSYFNPESTIFVPAQSKKSYIRDFYKRLGRLLKKEIQQYDYASLQYTPVGNSLVTTFAREAIIQNDLGHDTHPDLLTICFDSSRLIGEMFGPRSIEVEDMYYRLDKDLGDLLSFIFTQLKREDVIVVLTSDHGTSDAFREDSRIPMGQFNTQQFKMIMNGFLSAQYEPGNWVFDYADRQLYLNRELIYNYGFNLAEVQARAAAFALQFRGVSHAVSSTALQSSYFGGGVGERIQNSFYPKRSGDLIINLMPGWIEEREGKISLSGSLYEYDTHVPLIFLGGRLGRARIGREIEMTAITPTLARVLQITPPNASTGAVLDEVSLPYENR